MRKNICFYLLLLGLSLSNNLNAQSGNKTRLNNDWKFLKSDLGGIWEAVRPFKIGDPEGVPQWESVTLPHCFNASDAVDPDVNYYQGPGWYKNQIEVKNPYKNGRTLLHFEGAGQKTEVYVYLTKVGAHVGGYDEWSVDITDAVQKFLQNKNVSDRFKGKIPVSIRCDNSRDVEMIPSDLSDFNLYGGIYRYLNLVYQSAFSIEKLHVNASVDAKGTEGTVELNLKFLNHTSLAKAGLKIEIIDPTGKLLTTKAQETDFSPGEVPILTQTYKKPLLWSPDQPNLYTCNVTIETEAGSQTVSEYFGFRNFEFVEKGPFNGSAIIRVQLNGGKSVATVKSKVLKTAFLEL